jgi:tetratricopeptide (TPR) repeat protein
MAPDPAEQGPQSQPKAKIFISYSRKDIVFADRIEGALKARGFEPLIDRTEIYAFEDWWKRIEALVAQADTVIFVLSPDAVTSEVCAREVTFAASLNKRFAPIVLRRVDDKLVPEALARLNFIFFDDDAKFADSLDRLCDALATDIDWIRKHTEYGGAARHWASAGWPGGLLLRSPVLEEAERWIASRPHGAPAPTEETQGFIVESRRGATRRRNVLTGSLAAGLVVALVLAGIAYWQRGVAIEQRQIADQQRERAERTLALATRTANNLVFDLAQKFRNAIGVPAATVKDILDRARALQEQLLGSGESNPQLRFSQAAALGEISTTLLALGETAAALAAAKQDQEIFQSLVTQNPDNSDFALNLSVADYDVGNVQLVQGDLAAALASYQASLAIRERWAKANPADTEWQHRLADVHDRIGLVLFDQFNLPAALASYQAAFEIVDRLAKAEPDKAQWQGDLSVAYEKLGSVQMAQGDLAAALTSYQQHRAITERLATSDPGNAGWQRDLYLAHAEIGDVAMAQGNPAAALSSF